GGAAVREQDPLHHAGARGPARAAARARVRRGSRRCGGRVAARGAEQPPLHALAAARRIVLALLPFLVAATVGRRGRRREEPRLHAFARRAAALLVAMAAAQLDHPRARLRRDAGRIGLGVGPFFPFGGGDSRLDAQRGSLTKSPSFIWPESADMRQRDSP